MRVASLNVHGWRDAKNTPNFDRLLAWLTPMQLDVLVLQEVAATKKANRVSVLATKLGMQSHVTVQDVAVLSRWPLGHVALVPRDSDHHQVLRHRPSTTWRESERFQRRLIIAEVIPDEDMPFEVACVHFDHHSEPHRFSQWKALRTALGALPSAPRLLMGDMNALTQSDYNAAEWRHVAAIRERSNWEPPTSELTDALRADGWADLWQAARQGGAAAGVLAHGDRSTCRFNTRIDYICADKRFCDAWTLQSIAHCPTDATDHALVLAELMPVLGCQGQRSGCGGDGGGGEGGGGDGGGGNGGGGDGGGGEGGGGDGGGGNGGGGDGGPAGEQMASNGEDEDRAAHRQVAAAEFRAEPNRAAIEHAADRVVGSVGAALNSDGDDGAGRVQASAAAATTRLHYVTGDATQAYCGKGRKILAHICNDQGRWGKGFVMAVSARWPQVAHEYRKWHRHGKGFGLGEVQLTAQRVAAS